MEKASHIYRNGTILTMDSRCSIVSCIAVKGESIMSVGSDQHVAACRDSSTHIIDLKGKFVLPGFYDCHSHFMRAGMYNEFYLDLNAFPIGQIKNMDDIRGRIRKRAQSIPAGTWILCAGYDDTAISEGRHFTISELDEISPDHPLFLRHISGHCALCNSKAFQTAGITTETADPAGGFFRRNHEGKLTGLIEEPAAMEMVLEASPSMTDEKWLASVMRATNDYVAKGVTTAHDGGVTTPMWINYMEAHRRGLLKNRVQLLPRHGSFDFKLARTTTPGSPLTIDKKLSLGAVKIFQDGSLQAYTGFLSNPYYKIINKDLPELKMWRGYSSAPRNKLIELITRYHKDGWQVAIHGNGDDGIEEIPDRL